MRAPGLQHFAWGRGIEESLGALRATLPTVSPGLSSFLPSSVPICLCSCFCVQTFGVCPYLPPCETGFSVLLLYTPGKLAV